MTLKVGIIGARTTRQGTGPWMARDFAAAGCEVSSFVGTRPETILEAKERLKRDFGLDCQGFLSLQEMLEARELDIVADCSPSHLHREHLRTCAKFGVHVLCEKPLWWREETPENEDLERDALRILESFHQQSLLVELNTQWPWTLPFFWELHPQVKGLAVESLTMLLSPVSHGSIMVVDSAPHLLSMIHGLLGPGRITKLAAKIWPEAPDNLERRELEFVYHHEGGESDIQFILQRCPKQPRPAWYSINGHRANRIVTLPEYTMSFVDGDRQVTLDDPLGLRIRDFVQSVRQGEITDCAKIAWNLCATQKLVLAAENAESSLAAKGDKS